MTTKEKRLCNVCTKYTETECSHVDCPNRKVITADIGDSGAPLMENDAGSWYRRPTMRDGDNHG